MCLVREKIPIKNIDKRIGYVVMEKNKDKTYSSYCKYSDREYKKGKRYKATFIFRDKNDKCRYKSPSFQNTGGFYGFKYKIHAKKWKQGDYEAKIVKCLFENVIAEGQQKEYDNILLLAFRAKYRTIICEV